MPNILFLGWSVRLEVRVDLLTESEPVPSVIPLEHHLLPFLHQLYHLLFDLTQVVIQLQLHISIIKHLCPKTGYYSSKN